ncbi:MAG: single-stranded DNA-binding protein [Clostridia bacterium]|nr:single-stranded DNA-binding protein [Clostridia bacterium]
MNKAILMGRLTKDPELRYSNTSNVAVCRFTVAVDRRFARQGEERQADFIPIVAFGKTGEFCSKYFQKGSKIALVGSIQTRTWDDNEGKKHYATEVVADEAYFADSKKNEGAPSRASSGSDSDQVDGFYPIDNEDDLPF